jgi:hypothetical protein
VKFANASTVESVVWQMRLAEYRRGQNRARIDQLADGWPPYPEGDPNRSVNSNDLSLTRIAHNARAQLYQGHFKPGNAFTARTDMGVQHKRADRGAIVTKEINAPLKRSMEYYELQRSKFAQDILHGVGIGVWNSSQLWCPDPTAICDVLIPSGTLLTFKNLPFLGICREYTAEELYRLTHGPMVDPGWNMEVVDAAIKWAMQETSKLMGNSWTAAYWAPEKAVALYVENSGLLASNLVQTISLIDFFFYDSEGNTPGWRRRLVFDAWGGYSTYQGGTVPDKNLIGGRDQWVYNSGDRAYASKISEFIHFQFADLSAVAPFRYHSVRSLGHMLFDPCHLQNRLNCATAEAVFEQLMLYFRVNSRDDAERALKIQLMHLGLIDPSVQFIPPSERWQPNPQMIEIGKQQFQRIIDDNSSSYVQNQNFSRDRVEKTAFQVSAEINAMMTLVSAALQQSYKYQMNEYREIFRRFMIPNSRDPDVRDFRVRCLKRGIPEKMLVPEAWDLEPERVMGSGNKTLEMAIAQQLMEWRAAFGAEAQQTILHDAVLAITDDAAKARALVPQQEQLTDARHDAMVSFGSLMAGGEVQWKPNVNRTELAQVLLGEYGLVVAQIGQSGGMATMPQIIGLSNVSKHIAALIEQISSDKAQQQVVRAMSDALGKLDNELKGFAQRLQEQQQSQNGNGEAAKLRAEIEADLIKAKAKAQITAESHSQRTAQRAAQHQLKMEQDEQSHALDMQAQLAQVQTDAAAIDIKTAAEIRATRAKAAAEPKEPTNE